MITTNLNLNTNKSKFVVSNPAKQTKPKQNDTMKLDISWTLENFKTKY